ncbi:flagellar basal body rod protein FlgC [Motilibacter aurantiacus]|uniref:flagellar basal body rod protein FlgC n=1 Tax=Motilibacter aurantiacus TaxID=2714955 RepID=UPI00140BEB43|nr:flagellar basal body rod C-terminal domain-containing protein [Motilibacter aurantiacus]NHC47092.1 flagellar basal-body rod protein FlgC [Motilibacter aurantiacus]
MGLFNAIDTAGSGVTVYRKWLDAVSDNVTNMNTARRTSEDAFQAKYVLAQARNYGDGTGGVQVGGIALGSREGRVVHDPDHPLADADGNVRMPDIDLSSQMTQMLMAQRGYQANLATVERAQEAYRQAIQIGKG